MNNPSFWARVAQRDRTSRTGWRLQPKCSFHGRFSEYDEPFLEVNSWVTGAPTPNAQLEPAHGTKVKVEETQDLHQHCYLTSITTTPKLRNDTDIISKRTSQARKRKPEPVVEKPLDADEATSRCDGNFYQTPKKKRSPTNLVYVPPPPRRVLQLMTVSDEESHPNLILPKL
jgi:hypothetical protein